MSVRSTCGLLLLFVLLQTGPARADERAAILEVMDKAFAAVKSGEPDDWRAIQLAEGTTLSFRPHPGGVAGKLEMRIANNEDFIADLQPGGHEYIERWTAEPTAPGAEAE